MRYSIFHAELLAWLEEQPDNYYHALFCDPPYHLTEIVKRFGGANSKPAQFGRDGAFARAAAGFMGKFWDGGDIAFRAETWYALGRKLLPGGFGAAYASSKGYHRMAVAIEDAGLILHPTVFMWVNGQGMPKATRIDLQADRRAGVDPAKRGTKRHSPKFAAAELGYREKDNGFNSRDRESFDVLEAMSDLGIAWRGHRYGGQVLKPMVEPLVIFQRPYEGSPAGNILATGAGALNVDGSRIGTDEITINRWLDGAHPFGGGAGNPYEQVKVNGLWPTNFVPIHSWRCDAGGCAEDCPISQLEQQAGGGRSGFFFQGHWSYDVYEQLMNAQSAFYAGKPNTSEKEAGLEHRMTETVGDGRPTPIDNAFQRGEKERLNVHPTVKPLSANIYFSKLLLPPAYYAPNRRILIPFAGSGSEMIGSMLAGWDEIVGVEAEDEYALDLAPARLSFWESVMDKPEVIEAVNKNAPPLPKVRKSSKRKITKPMSQEQVLTMAPLPAPQSRPAKATAAVSMWDAGWDMGDAA